MKNDIFLLRYDYMFRPTLYKHDIRYSESQCVASHDATQNQYLKFNCTH